MRSVRNVIALVGLVVCEVAAIVALHRLGRLPWLDVDVADPTRWLALTPPDDAIVALARLVAVAAAWWLLATTLLAIVTHAPSRPHHGPSRAARLTPRVVRLVVDRALTTSVAVVVATSAPAAAAGFAAPPPPAVSVPADAEEAQQPPAPPGTRPPDVRAPASTPRVHIVQPGEHLWSIAAGQVHSQRPARIHGYWWRVVTANRDRLASGDPDLIHAGERVVLPRRVSRR